MVSGRLARLSQSVCLGLMVACFAPMPAQGEHPAPIQRAFDEVDDRIAELKSIMGFGPRHPVKLRAIDKNEFLDLYRTHLRKESSPKKLHGERLFLQTFGFVDEDFDYEQSVLDLMGEQAWALYDFQRKNLYLADWAPEDALEFAFVHELVHAIDDQTFNLRKFTKAAEKSEEQAARLAVMEGQAAWVMTEWVMRQNGRSLEGNRMLAIATASATRFEAQQFPVFRSTPLYLREALIFPYSDGLMFQHDMIERYGKDGLKRVFTNPPTTTQHVLQPDLYVQGVEPESPALPDFKVPRGYRVAYAGEFGQLDNRILFEQHLGEGEFGALLDGWRGGQFEILEDRRSGKILLRYAAAWESEETAQEYYHLYRQICERKLAGLELVSVDERRCEGTTERGKVWLELNGSVVRSVEHRYLSGDMKENQ